MISHGSVIVCGGRDYDDRKGVNSILGLLPGFIGDLVIATGACSGADRLAEDWARENGVLYRGYPARWKTEGRSAGPRRNERMLESELMSGLELVIAFPGGDGTANMVRLAREDDVPILLFGVAGNSLVGEPLLFMERLFGDERYSIYSSYD